MHDKGDYIKVEELLLEDTETNIPNKKQHNINSEKTVPQVMIDYEKKLTFQHDKLVWKAVMGLYDEGIRQIKPRMVIEWLSKALENELKKDKVDDEFVENAKNLIELKQSSRKITKSFKQFCKAERLKPVAQKGLWEIVEC
jgi:hypothetical protein